MRLFVGIYPTPEYLSYFREVMREFDKEKRNLKPINLEQVHLTMRFIGGRVSDGSKNEILRALKENEGKFSKPLIHMKSLTFGFQSQQNPRVLLANIERTKDLDHLTNELHHVIRNLGFKDTIIWKQQQDSQYHMSIARLKPNAAPAIGRRVREIARQVNLNLPSDYQATELHLVQSVLTQKGPIYQKLEKIEL